MKKYLQLFKKKKKISQIFFNWTNQLPILHGLKGLAMIFAGQENPFIIFRSKKIYIYFKTNNKMPINLLK